MADNGPAASRLTKRAINAQGRRCITGLRTEVAKLSNTPKKLAPIEGWAASPRTGFAFDSLPGAQGLSPPGRAGTMQAFPSPCEPVRQIAMHWRITDNNQLHSNIPAPKLSLGYQRNSSLNSPMFQHRHDIMPVVAHSHTTWTGPALSSPQLSFSAKPELAAQGQGRAGPLSRCGARGQAVEAWPPELASPPAPAGDANQARDSTSIDAKPDTYGK